MKKGIPIQIPIMSLLNTVTCGVYHIYWIYKTSDEIKKFTERDDINPSIEILLGIFTWGAYFRYWYYKYGKIVYKEMPLKINADNQEDKTLFIVVIDLIIYSMMILNILAAVIVTVLIALTGDNDYLSGLSGFPITFLYINNIPSLIFQDRLNNFWKKVKY